MTDVLEDDRVAVDMDDMRMEAVAAYGLAGADNVYTFYYDESENPRRIHVTSTGLNVDPRIYVLGGIVQRGPPRGFGFAELRAALRLQSNVTDLKFKHVASGGFLRVLTSSKLTTFLDWLTGSELLVHYVALDPVYWSVVDIVDAAVPRGPLESLAPALKNDLYAVLRTDLPGLFALFRRHGYPEVGPSGPAFMAELLDIVQERRDMLDEFGFGMLQGVLRMGGRATELPFAGSDGAGVLVESLAPFVRHRICLFKNSRHVLDDEPRIKRILRGNRFMDGGREVRIHRFARSHDEPGVQVSDVVAGLLSKCFTWLNGMDAGEVVAVRAGLDRRQERNRRLLSGLLERSARATPAFAQRIFSVDDWRGNGLFLGD